MFDVNTPIEYHYESHTWCEAVLISYDLYSCSINCRMPGTTDCWTRLLISSKSFDRIRNVVSTDTFDPDMPIEFNCIHNYWCEAVLLDINFNGKYLIKYRLSPTSPWVQEAVSIQNHRSIRNEPEKRTYRVAVIKDGYRRCEGDVWFTKVSKAYSIGDKYCGGIVIGYHEGEFTV